MNVRSLAVTAAAMCTLGAVASCAKPVTATMLASDINRQMTLPTDLGNGFRLDSVTASGQDLISTVTLVQISRDAVTPALTDALVAVGKTDTCRHVAPVLKQYVDANIRMVKVFKDRGGVEITRVAIDPRQCAGEPRKG